MTQEREEVRNAFANKDEALKYVFKSVEPHLKSFFNGNTNAVDYAINGVLNDIKIKYKEGLDVNRAYIQLRCKAHKKAYMKQKAFFDLQLSQVQKTTDEDSEIEVAASEEYEPEYQKINDDWESLIKMVLPETIDSIEDPITRAIYNMRLKGKKNVEIAELLGLSTANVRQRFHRCIQSGTFDKLKQWL